MCVAAVKAAVALPQGVGALADSGLDVIHPDLLMVQLSGPSPVMVKEDLTAGLREAPAGGRRAGDTVRAGAGRNGLTRAPWTHRAGPFSLQVKGGPVSGAPHECNNVAISDPPA
ncbi:hypothetical protein Maq22A_c26660 [Methylobacterium aquaticum]|uniref:Uncharacterized protein n=1 Tax=Methylobacterium aquaticum TaxID=270351 RepID=A0A0C6F615_9HYPH|nr:hypothetical protein Maq22A_c26660 [Methylobacterium aquaticum]